MSWGKQRRPPPRGAVKYNVSRKVKLLMALGALAGAILALYFAFQVAANCSAETGHSCIMIGEHAVHLLGK